MPKRPARENPKNRKGSEDMDDKDPKRRRKKSEDVTWVKDTTIENSDSDSDYDPDAKPEIEIQFDSQEAYEEFLANLLQSQEITPRRSTRKKNEQPELKLSKKELEYFNSLTLHRQKDLNQKMKKVKEYTAEDEIPLRFKVLDLPVNEYIKNSVMKKIELIDESYHESHKLRNWVDAFMKLPFGKIIPLPVSLKDGSLKCAQFMKQSKQVLDEAAYGMISAKSQIMQVLAQWIANPNSVGNVIALQGPPGVGKTNLAKNGIAKALNRPFEFFSLGGASDIANFTGHSYTYEGSVWGRIADSLMQAKCMNPVMYFDELDKISNTPHGEEIASMLIHLTDRTQNTQFHDRYFAGVDLDVSQCLFVFSLNDLSAVNPILKDRMTIIHCDGYSEKDKEVILSQYIFPSLLERLQFTKQDIEVTKECMECMITDYSQEQGVRSLIRCAETILTRLNMLRIADEETMKEYKFYTKVEFPLKLTPTLIKTLLCDTTKKELETWKSMYT